jgi:hypothetical protein
MATKAESGPNQAPPQGNGGAATSAGAAGTSAPESVSEGDLLEALAPAVEGKPSVEPPQIAEAEGVAAEAVTATWRSNQTVTALWSTNEIRNAWMYVVNLGWRKIYNGRDHAFTALVTLASQARQTGRPVTFREEADGMVHEIYLW